MPTSRKYELSFFTATILEWKFLLVSESYKDIIVGSLRHFVDRQKVYVYGFCIMDNHLHVLWHIIHPYAQDDVQRDFLKFIAQTIVRDLKQTNEPLLQEFFVGARDRKYQVWERNPLTVHIWSEEVLKQKLDYIHNNPVEAGLCAQPEDYKYSSASFYATGITPFEFLTSCFM